MDAPAAVSLIALRCGTSERTVAPVRGVEELAPLVGERLGVEARSIGSAPEPAAKPWDEVLRESRGCLLEAGGQVEDALEAGRIPVLLAAECSIALTTLATAARIRPDARVLWLDAHGDFNTPATSESGHLAGMSLAGACGLWDSGLGGAVDPERVVLVGVRDLEGRERELLEGSPVTVVGASLETLVGTQNALDRAPVYVHLDLDVIDPDDLPAEFPAPAGLPPDKLYDLLEAVAGECELVGLEVTAFFAPADRPQRQAAASTVLGAIEPLLAAVTKEAHVSH